MSLPGLLFLVVMLLLPFRAEAGRPVLAEDRTVTVLLDGIGKEEETIGLDLLCISRDQSERLICFLLPQINGEDTVFTSGWAGEEQLLPAGQETSVRLQIENISPESEKEVLTLRFAWMGKLSVPIGIDLDSPDGIRAVSFGEEEPSAVRTEIVSRMKLPAEPMEIHDRITPEEREKLDYGQAWICLKKDSELIPFCRVPLEVNDRGEASAVYEGVAFVPENDPYPLAVTQERTDAGTAFRTEEISLISPSIYYATMKLTMAESAEGSWAVTEQVFTSDEVGGAYPLVPLALAEQAELILRVLEDSKTPKETVSVHSSMVLLDKPLALTVCDVRSLGEICVYCEYFFVDKSNSVHPLRSIETDQK